MSKEKNVFIIILNYNNFEDTLECVDSLFQYNLGRHTLIIVDNASTNNSYDELEKNNLNRYILLRNEQNTGYAGGNNLGIRYALEHGADYLVVLNNDTVLNGDFLKPCIDFLNENPKAAFVSPCILDYKTKKIQSTGAMIDLDKGNVLLINNGKDIDEITENVFSDYVGGACVVLTRKTIENVGYIPENYFLFFEESEWCYLAKKRGFFNVCVSSAHILHKGSVSINAISGLHSYLMERNRVVFVKRNCISKMQYFRFLLFIFCKTLYRGITKDKKYFNDYLAYYDGVTGKVNSKKYPFIILNK